MGPEELVERYLIAARKLAEAKQAEKSAKQRLADNLAPDTEVSVAGKVYVWRVWKTTSVSYKGAIEAVIAKLPVDAQTLLEEAIANNTTKPTAKGLKELE